jgi:hypothetical protein
MSFTPVNTLLATVNEFQNISFTITYTSLFLGNQPVTITANQPLPPNIIINANNIRGFFSDSFDNIIRYRTDQDTFVEVSKFTEVDEEELYGIYHFDADSMVQIPYTFTASVPNGDTETYTIIVLHNYTPNRNQLVKYTNVEFYETFLKVLFINSNNDNVNWNNTLNQKVDWENINWPTS